MRNHVFRPSFQLCRNCECTGRLITVACTDKLEGVAFIALHGLPLCLKLEAVVVGVVAEGDVCVPGDWISDRLVRCVVFHAKSHCVVVIVTFGELSRSFVPVDTAE